MEKRPVTIDEILATFSSHVQDNYPAPVEFGKNLDVLLGEKRGRMESEEYRRSLERNVVFLDELSCEAENLVDRLVGEGGDAVAGEGELNEALRLIEERARQRTEERRGELLGSRGSEEFAELRRLRGRGGKAYIERLEFNYRFLMTLRILIFEFLGLVAAIRGEYRLPAAGDADFKRILAHIELTAHFYIGNLEVEAREAQNNAPA